ncbi:hypothetical protein SELMODRAFT_77761 [Selaginella moellendorffii]|uniref:Uncharacterized protein CYP797F1 n=1 Tax=Selaginella moellendorffii TaxID=88036 RepID=D8QRF7_SELML|nr:cytochrome P450 71A1 [Selaginella moellendorffii]EFJ37243.1 hypothetical protein SELMODRAFT_77761 [Selaginella moellendorffii]|eukprot:XP_002961983.1 cytochrome P450 71A1 [Selaginella moellendorffii]
MEFLVYVLLGSVFLFYLLVRPFLQPRKLLPPSPRGLPFIGHLHLLGRQPHISLQELSNKFGDIVCLRLGLVPAILISSSAAAREALKTHDQTFSGRPYFLLGDYVYSSKSMVLSPPNEHWRRMKKLFNAELFTANRLASFLEVRREELASMVSFLIDNQSRVVNVRELVRSYTFNTITRIVMSKRFFGEKNTVNEEEAMEFMEVMEEIIKFGFAFHISELVPAWLRWIDWKIPAVKRIAAREDIVIQKILDEHRKTKSSRGTKDFLDILLEHDTKGDGGGNDLDNARGTIMELVGAGTYTTACVIEWAILELLRNPDVLEKAQHELESIVGQTNRLVEESDIEHLTYLQAIVKETFRLHPPAPLLLRMSTQECVISNYHIPKGANTFVNVYAIGRDPGLWENPMEFWPERFVGSSMDVRGQDFELIPFGAGRRTCAGLTLGLKVVQVGLANLLHGFDWSCVAGRDYNVAESSVSVIWPKKPLEAIVILKSR